MVGDIQRVGVFLTGVFYIYGVFEFFLFISLVTFVLCLGWTRAFALRLCSFFCFGGRVFFHSIVYFLCNFWGSGIDR